MTVSPKWSTMWLFLSWWVTVEVGVFWRVAWEPEKCKLVFCIVFLPLWFIVTYDGKRGLFYFLGEMEVERWREKKIRSFLINQKKLWWMKVYMFSGTWVKKSAWEYATHLVWAHSRPTMPRSGYLFPGIIIIMLQKHHSHVTDWKRD